MELENGGTYDGSGGLYEMKVVAVMPRVNPLRLGSGTNQTQGKSANQLNALRAASGHLLQVLDCNMDFMFCEALKLPVATQKFYPDREDRETAKCRILGFREHVFSADHSSCGQVMDAVQLHPVTSRYISLYTVTHRCIPLHTVTHRYHVDPSAR